MKVDDCFRSSLTLRCSALKQDLVVFSCDRNYVRIVGGSVKRNGEDMLRKTGEGTASTGAKARSATGGKAYDWCVCVCTYCYWC